jgi:hypothetical protein
MEAEGPPAKKRRSTTWNQYSWKIKKGAEDHLKDQTGSRYSAPTAATP